MSCATSDLSARADDLRLQHRQPSQPELLSRPARIRPLIEVSDEVFLIGGLVRMAPGLPGEARRPSAPSPRLAGGRQDPRLVGGYLGDIAPASRGKARLLHIAPGKPGVLSPPGKPGAM
jgi:hypothetical protein